MVYVTAVVIVDFAARLFSVHAYRIKTSRNILEKIQPFTVLDHLQLSLFQLLNS
jgi:hypothetical protein